MINILSGNNIQNGNITYYMRKQKCRLRPHLIAGKVGQTTLYFNQSIQAQNGVGKEIWFPRRKTFKVIYSYMRHLILNV